MSLRPSELAQVGAELTAQLTGAILQKAWAARPKLCHLELRQLGRSTLLCISVEPGVARLSVAVARPAAQGPAPALQRQLREHLTGARLVRVETQGSTAVLAFERKGEVVNLVTELDAGEIRLDRNAAAAPLGPSLPGARAEAKSSRLAGGPEPLALARAAEALLGAAADARALEQRRRRAVAPLQAKLARLKRTLPKVREDAARGPQAEEHRALGELVSRNLSAIPRGTKSARLTEYTADGAREREVQLDPKRSAKEEAAWHFKQYQRLTRGCALAARREAQLTAEASALEARIAELERAPADSLPEAKPPASSRPRAAPFHEYRSGDSRIWVGKDARGNDALTFGVARSHHVWLHARGVPGSHVVVPLEKRAVLPPQLLLDAAHLALFHSSLKGEPRGEVAYTRVQHVRRVKGGAPGEVQYSQEKTFVVRVEPARLERLARSIDESTRTP
jgi:predicted ribosome quality control (RQC) complex YloA/Tae2 family protein